MDAIRNKFIKNIKTQIKENEKWCEEAKELLKKEGNMDVENHSSVLSYREKIRELKEQLQEGSDDAEFQIFAASQLKLHTKKTTGSFFQEPVKAAPQREDRWADIKIQNKMNREWNWICRMDNYMPSYMRENLRKMPNNKGYIWKGIHYYGNLPCEHPKDVNTLFEKNNQILYIHEYGRGFYRFYEKKDKTKTKTLVEERYF